MRNMIETEYKANNREKQIGVVVLNYNNFKETINCVESLLKQKDVDFTIVVVDNGSNNDSAEVLTEKFRNITKVNVVQSKKNLGYARGNNVGIDYLRKKGCDFIFIANSDLLFCNEKTLFQIVEEYEHGVGLINPIIKNPNNSIDQRVSYKKNMLYLRMFKKFLEWYTNKDIAINRNDNLDSIEAVKEIVGKQTDRYIVAGSGFLLTRDFFNNYHGLYPETFLYYEEWATIILLNKAALFTKVALSDPIIHKGGASTPQNIRTMSKQRRSICLDSWKAIFRLALTSKRKVKEKY